MFILKECSRLVRVASRKSVFPCLLELSRPVSIASHQCVLLKQTKYPSKHPLKHLVAYYGQWNPNIVKSKSPDIPIPNTKFIDVIWPKLDQYSDYTAMVCGITGREVKYSELKEQSSRVAAFLLKDLKIKPGQVIATVLPNIMEFPPIIFGAMAAGIIISPVNPAYTADEIAYQIKDSGSVLAVTFPTKLKAVQDAVSTLGFKNFNIVVTSGNKDPLPEGVQNLTDLLANADLSCLSTLTPKSFSMDDTIIIPYSSGTTGKPKGVCLTNQNLVANNIAMLDLREFNQATGNFQEVLPVLLPIYHIYGFSVILCQALVNGAKLIMLPKFEEETFLRALKDHKATILYVAPPLVIYLGNSPNVTENHLKTLKTILNGAAPVGELDIKKCLQKSPPNVTYKQGYGLTETSPGVCCMPVGYKIYTSVGPPVANTLVKVIDVDTKQALGNNEEGEILCKGPQVMKGYLNNPKATEETIDKDGWFHTGDVGYYDSNGFFYITDRLKELIKVKGFQVAPAELESLLRSHPDIADAGVIGVPHQLHGEAPVGFIALKQGKSTDKNNLKEFLKDKVAKYKQIEEFIFVEAIPKSAAGKILRKDLRVMYQKLKGV